MMSDFDNFEKRLDNWGRVVRSPRYQSGTCAAWARWFVSKRGSIEDDKCAPTIIIPTLDRDGWVIEKAWCALGDATYKWVLKYDYVWRMNPDQIRIRLQKVHKISIRGKNWDVMINEAHAKIKKSLAKF